MALTGYNNALELTIDNTKIDSTLTNFPVLVSLSSSTGTNTFDATHVFDTVTSGSEKIAITDVNDNQLYVEVEKWDYANEKASLWVKVPTISSTADTTLYLYYDATASGNSTYVGATGTTPAKAVWDNDFTAVYHMAQSPTGNTLDSTANEYHAPSYGGMVSGDLVDGKVGDCLTFNGSDEYLDTGFINLSDVTFSVIANVDAFNTGNRQMLVGAGEDTNLYGTYFNIDSDGQSIDFFTYETGGGVHGISNYSYGFSATTWYYIAGTVFDNAGSSVYKLFINEAQKTSATTSFTPALNNSTYFIAAFNDARGGFGAESFFKGKIDEVRISSAVRDPAWLKAEYYTAWNNLISYSEVFSSSNWANFLTINIDHTKIDEDLTNFPVLITLASGVGTNTYDATHVFDTVTSGSKQIAVTDSNDNQLYVEIENWDYQNEKAYLWVKVPTVSSGIDTTLYLYYDSNQSDNTDYIGDVGDVPAQSVWTNGFSRVYHLNGDPASGVIDSVGNGNGTAGGSLNSSDLVDSKIYKGYDFDRSTSDRFVVADGTDLDLNTWAVELIYNPKDVSNNQNLIEKRQSGQNDYYTNFVIQDRETDGQILVFFGWTSNYAVDNPSYAFSTGTDYHIVGRYDGTVINTFVNGQKQGSGQSTTQTPHQSGSDVTWVGGSSKFGNYADGIIDEVRIQTNRSDAWIKATYYSNWDNLISFTEAQPTTAFPKIFVGGQWVNVDGVWIYIDGQWRTVNEMKIYIQGAWRSLV